MEWFQRCVVFGSPADQDDHDAETVGIVCNFENSVSDLVFVFVMFDLCWLTSWPS